MKHKVEGKKLNRDTAHRKALAKNLSDSLVTNKSIETTLAKAKFIRPYVEKLVTRAKKDKGFTTVKYLKNKLSTDDAVRILINDLADSFKNRNGGYTKITKLPERDGDKAKMARIEFIIEKPAKKTAKKTETKKSEKPADESKPETQEIENYQNENHEEKVEEENK